MALSRVLKGVVCSVKALNEDGTDASNSLTSLLESLGAAVHPELREGHTHLVWSNASPSAALAAHFLGCNVVSPLWVQECAHAKKRLPDSHYLVDVDYLKSKAARGSIVEPVVDQSPGLAAGRRRLVRACDKVKRASEGSSSEALIDTARIIPLPAFKEICTEPLLQVDQSVRRSERLVDSFPSPSPAPSPSVSAKGCKVLRATKVAPRPMAVAAVEQDMEFVKSVTPHTVFRILDNEADLYAGRTGDTDAAIPELQGGQALSLVKENIKSGKHGGRYDGKHDGKRTDRESRNAIAKPSTKAKQVVEQSPSCGTKRAIVEESPRASKVARVAVAKRPIPSKSSTDHKESSRESTQESKRERSSDAPGAKKNSVRVGRGRGALLVSFSGFRADEADTLASLVPALQLSTHTSICIETDVAARAHVLVVDDKEQIRTVKVLYALVRGVPVVTRDWVYSSLDAPADPRLFRHPRYRTLKLGVPLTFLAHKQILVAKGCELGAAVLGPLIAELGGRVVSKINSADLVLVSDNDSDAVVVAALFKELGRSTSDHEAIESLAKTKKILRLAFLLDCIAEGRWNERPARDTIVRAPREVGSPVVEPASQGSRGSSKVGFVENSPSW